MEQPNTKLLAAMEQIVQSKHPYVNNTLKRLAQAAQTRIYGEKKTN